VHKLHNSILRGAACGEHRKAIFYTENLQKIKFRHISRRFPTRLRQFDFKQKIPPENTVLCRQSVFFGSQKDKRRKKNRRDRVTPVLSLSLN